MEEGIKVYFVKITLGRGKLLSKEMSPRMRNKHSFVYFVAILVEEFSVGIWSEESRSYLGHNLS